MWPRTLLTGEITIKDNALATSQKVSLKGAGKWRVSSPGAGLKSDGSLNPMSRKDSSLSSCRSSRESLVPNQGIVGGVRQSKRRSFVSFRGVYEGLRT